MIFSQKSCKFYIGSVTSCCAWKKNDTVVKFTLPENSNIIASKYQLYLPSAEQLSKEIQNEVQKQKELGKE